MHFGLGYIPHYYTLFRGVKAFGLWVGIGRGTKKLKSLEGRGGNNLSTLRLRYQKQFSIKNLQKHLNVTAHHCKLLLSQGIFHFLPHCPSIFDPGGMPDL